MNASSEAPVGDIDVLYGWVRQTREVLFRYAASLPVAVRRSTHPGFHDSMLGLMAHAAECYQRWTGGVGQGLEVIELPRPVRELDDVRAQFRRVDDIVHEALADDLDRTVTWREQRLPLRWLVLHPITHEFHHKGQIATLGRMLGYPVPEGTDLDLVLPE